MKKNSVYIPDVFRVKWLIPEIGRYYSDNSGYNFEITYKTNQIKNEFCFLFSTGFENHSIQSENESVEIIFGQELKIRNYYLILGLGKYININSTKLFFSFHLGPVLNYYNGITKQDTFMAKFSYGKSMTFRVGFGLDLPIGEFLPLLISSFCFL